MAKNYLITGYWGEPHVTSENDRGIHAGTFGIGRFLLSPQGIAICPTTGRTYISAYSVDDIPSVVIVTFF